MIDKRLKELCEEKRLDTFLETLEYQIANSAYDEMSFEARLLELLENQTASDLSKAIKSLQKFAKLRYPDSYLENLEYELYPSLKINQMNQLATCDWIKDKRHLTIIGSTGLGKTNIACVLAQRAISQKFRVLFYRLNNLLLELVAAQNEGSLVRYIKKLNRVQLLIVDDWGNALMEKDERHLLFELIESRDKVGSMLITSQYPVKVWHEAFQDATIADSVLDRIVHNSHSIQLKGESIRKLIALREQVQLNNGDDNHA